MITNQKWHSLDGLIIDIQSGVFLSTGRLYHPSILHLKRYQFNLIAQEYHNGNEIAFIIDWKLPHSISHTAFQGKVSAKGDLLLNWFLTMENNFSKERNESHGSLIFYKSLPFLRSSTLIEFIPPYPPFINQSEQEKKNYDLDKEPYSGTKPIVLNDLRLSKKVRK